MRPGFAVATLALACAMAGSTPPRCFASSTAGAQRRPVRLEVRGLPDWERLKMRQAPGNTSPAVGEIPPRAGGIIGTGRQRHVGRALWHEVEYQGVRGWVHGRYVRLETAAPGGAAIGPASAKRPFGDQHPVFTEDLVCVGNVPAWKLVVDRDGSTAASPAFGRALSDVHALGAEIHKGTPRAWSITLADAQGVGVATLLLRETRCSPTPSTDVYGFEVTTHQPDGTVLTGCCNLRARAPVVAGSPRP
jgi:hypothetical protein